MYLGGGNVLRIFLCHKLNSHTVWNCRHLLKESHIEHEHPFQSSRNPLAKWSGWWIVLSHVCVDMDAGFQDLFNWALSFAHSIPLWGHRGFLVLRFVPKQIHTQSNVSEKETSLRWNVWMETSRLQEERQTIFLHFIYSWKIPSFFFFFYIFFQGLFPQCCAFSQF